GKNPDEKPVVSRQISLVPGKDDYDASFDITDWDIGRYVVSACLQDKSKKPLSSVCRVFIKKKIGSAEITPPAPKVSLRSDGIILLDEKPFCPFFASTPKQDKKSSLVKDCFNVGYAGFGDVSRPLERTSIGLPGWTREQGPNGTKTFTLLPEEEKMLENIRNAVTARKADPLLLYWFMSYEATIPMYRGKENRVRLNNADELRKISRFVKSIDPDHPTAIEIDSGNWADYKDSADIIEVACISSYAKYLILNLIKDVDDVRNALGQGKPFILWIGSSIPSADRRTAEEIRCASYLALMHGAAGIVFHMGHEGISPSMTRHWSVYTGLSREVEELFPILTASRPVDGCRIAIDPAGIDYCIREYNNRLYLVAVNTSGSLVKARISIADCSGISKRINVLFENREIELTGSGFVDVFTAFEPHVYEFR
ncbi:MAG: hypothetical protein KKF10_07530, partial [Verrucomicrobia bacterium]|nr:hypothetical protein [Verrucomicrobiota bacterium]